MIGIHLPRRSATRRPLRWAGRVVTGAGLLLSLAGATAAPGLDDWLAQQTNVLSWTAEVRQTRTLRSLNTPLTTLGRVWFQAPNLFRWELGRPAQTIAVRESERLVLLYPRLKRAEIYPLDDDHPGPWRDSLTLLEAGFPRKAEDLESRFKILSVREDGGALCIELQPRTSAARRWIPSLQVCLQREDLSLLATELVFGDGSRLRNDFTNQVANPVVPPELLRAAIPEDYEVVRPAPTGGVQ